MPPAHAGARGRIEEAPEPVGNEIERRFLARRLTEVRVCSPNCIPNGGTCTANADCCGGYCDPQTLTCVTIIL